MGLAVFSTDLDIVLNPFVTDQTLGWCAQSSLAQHLGQS